MRVLIACPYAIDLPGGVQVHVRDLADQLRTRGHDVAIVAPVAGDPPEGVIGVGRPTRVSYAGTVAPIAPFSRRAVRAAMRTFGPDVVHAHEPYVPSASLHAVRTSTAPVVATFHAYLEGDRAARVAARVLLRGVGRRIDARIAVSHAAADHAAAFDDGEVEIIPGYREVVRDGIEGLLVPPADATALAAALRRVLTEPDLAARLAGAGRERARSFAWDAVVPRIEDVYRRVTGGRAGGGR